MKEEIILSGVIDCDLLTSQELKRQIQQEIFSKLASSMVDRIEIHFGPRLYRRLRTEDMIDYPSHTIGEFNCITSYVITPYS